MTVDNQPLPAPGAGAVPGVISRPMGHGIRRWAGNSDAVQLSRLGGVLNVFASDASSSSDRIGRLQAAVRDGSYSADGAALSRKLMSEMVGRR